MNILITGATGFIGTSLAKKLASEGNIISAAVRSSQVNSPLAGVNYIAVGDIDSNTKWSEALKGVDLVIHLAGRVHVMREKLSDPVWEYRKINVAGTLNLARACKREGVRRFIFLSTIKVNGESTFRGGRFTECDEPNPADAYASSKLEAEQGLIDVAENSNLEFVIIRPPLVYGPGVKANFHSLLRICASPIPLPFGGISNSRSFISIDNLIDFIGICSVHPAAANELFLVSDGADLSTPQLIEKIRLSMGLAPKLFSFPLPLLKFIAGALGASSSFSRLYENLSLDIRKSKRLLGWNPIVTIDQGILAIANQFQKNK